MDVKPARWPPWARTAAQVAAVIAFVLAVRAFQQRGVASGVAPALAGRDLAGHAVSLADFRGKPVVVHFWATWCEVCNMENSAVDAFARDHDVITVAASSGDAATVRAAMEQRGLHFPVIVDRDGEQTRLWGVRAFPTSFFLGGDQRIRYSETGFTTSLGFKLRNWLAGR